MFHGLADLNGVGMIDIIFQDVVLKNDGIALVCLHFTEDVFNRARVDIFQEKPSEKDVNFQFENTKNRQYAETPYFFYQKYGKHTKNP